MVKLLALLDDPIWLAIIIGQFVYILSLRRRMRGINEPELWLPRKERRAHARKLLKREDEQYEEQMIARLTEALQGKQPDLGDGRNA